MSRLAVHFVAGSRSLHGSKVDRAYLFDHMDGWLRAVADGHSMPLVVHGHCKTGPDAWADDWAASRGVTVAQIPAQWRHYGRAAGHRRNAMMGKLIGTLDEGGANIHVSVGWQGTSSGTGDMTVHLRRAGFYPVPEFGYWHHAWSQRRNV